MANITQLVQVNYSHEIRIAVDVAREAGAAILEFYRGPLEVAQKYDRDDREPVTKADLIANQLIVERLRAEFPNDGILAEESEDTTERLGRTRVWMIDPLDGTTGFIAGNGDFAVQIGLAVNGKSILGVVYQPLTGILYHALQGEGAWVERPKQPVQRAVTSTHTDVHSMRLAASRSHRSPRMDQVVKAFGVKEEVRRGSVGIKIGLIIEQQCDFYIHLSPRTKQWDTCAPEVILTEAGGKLTDLFGRPLLYNVPEVQNRNGLVASNGPAHDRIIKTLEPLLSDFHRLPV